jgi:hypothetical protein
MEMFIIHVQGYCCFSTKFIFGKRVEQGNRTCKRSFRVVATNENFHLTLGRQDSKSVSLKEVLVDFVRSKCLAQVHCAASAGGSPRWSGAPGGVRLNRGRRINNKIPSIPTSIVSKYRSQ